MERRRGSDHQTVTEAFHAAIAEFSPMGDDLTHTAAKAGRVSDAYQPSRLNSIEELPLALGFALVNDGAFRASVEDGINSGRDTDSIGVMAGAILGALHGERWPPKSSPPMRAGLPNGRRSATGCCPTARRRRPALQSEPC